MKKIALLIPGLITLLILIAHFYRSNNLDIIPLIVIVPFLLISKSRWTLRLFQILLIYTAVEYLFTLYGLAVIRLEMGMPYLRLSIILLGVSAFALTSALLINRKKFVFLFNKSVSTSIQSLSSFLLVFGTLFALTQHAPIKLLLSQRLFPSFVMLLIFIVSLCAAVLTGMFLKRKKTFRRTFVPIQ